MPFPKYHCPRCQSELPKPAMPQVRCTSCEEQYNVVKGIPHLISSHYLDHFKNTEQHFHDEKSLKQRMGSVQGRNSLFHQHFLKPMLELPKGSIILEVACGTRLDGMVLAQAGHVVDAIDISPEAVERAQELARANRVEQHMRFAVADAEHLPFPRTCFDASFVAASFHHFPHQLEALQEMKRVTKPDGLVIWGVEPQAWPYNTIFKSLAPLKRYIRAKRKRGFDSIADDTTSGYTKTQIQDLFSQAGLLIIEIKPVKLLSEFYDSFVRLLNGIFNKNLEPSRSLDRALSRFDEMLSRVSFLRRFFWHWNVISKVPTQ